MAAKAAHGSSPDSVRGPLLPSLGLTLDLMTLNHKPNSQGLLGGWKN